MYELQFLANTTLQVSFSLWLPINAPSRTQHTGTHTRVGRWTRRARGRAQTAYKYRPQLSTVQLSTYTRQLKLCNMIFHVLYVKMLVFLFENQNQIGIIAAEYTAAIISYNIYYT